MHVSEDTFELEPGDGCRFYLGSKTGLVDGAHG